MKNHPLCYCIHCNLQKAGDCDKMTGPCRHAPDLPTEGKGTRLEKWLTKFGFKKKKKCRCNYVRDLMDRKGTKWCRVNFDWILKQLEAEADRRKIQFDHEKAAKLLKFVLWTPAQADAVALPIAKALVKIDPENTC